MTCELLHQGPGCDGCGRTLKGRQSRWCSRKCQRAYTANHRWTQARAAAKAEAVYYLCAHATLGNKDCLGFTQEPEVNHIEPAMGKHGTWGCHHHQSNLEVLCKPCHRKVTAAQAKERAALRRKEKGK